MLKYLTSGESHGPQLTAVLDGFPAGFHVNVDQINYQLSRRQKGYGRGERMKIENDQVNIVSGVRHGYTLGSPITLVIVNRDWANWQETMDPAGPAGDSPISGPPRPGAEITAPRPGHADLPGAIKWGHDDIRNVLERASARETTARVAIGSLARQLLEYYDVQFASYVVRIGEVALTPGFDRANLKMISEMAELSEVRCIDGPTGQKMIDTIKAAFEQRESLGGIAELIVRGLPAGLGSCAQWSDRLDGRLAGAMMAIPSVKGVEIGLGFEAARGKGSEAHDEIFYDPYGDPARKKFHRPTNRAGGLEGGMTNGEDIIMRVAAKPLSTLRQPLRTVDIKTKQPTQATVERTDTCVVPALAVVCEAVAALVLSDAFLSKFGADNMKETSRNYRSFLADEF